MSHRQPATVQRESGIIVPASLAGAADPGQTHKGAPVVYDGDGRRRVMVSDQDRRLFDRLAKSAAASGQGLVLVCRNDQLRPDGLRACGQPMEREAWDTPDRGYGCLCTRTHFE